MTDDKLSLEELYAERPELKSILTKFAQRFIDNLSSAYFYWSRASNVTKSNEEKEILEKAADQFDVNLTYILFLHKLLGLPCDTTHKVEELEEDFQKLFQEALQMEQANKTPPKGYDN